MQRAAAAAIGFDDAVAGGADGCGINAQDAKRGRPRGGFAHRKKCKASGAVLPVVYGASCELGQLK